MNEEKSRAGISMTFLATAAWVSCINSTWIPFVVAGALLYLEQDKWLKKQMVQLIVVFATFRIFNCLLFDRIIGILVPRTLVSVDLVRIIIMLFQDIAYCVLAYKAWKHCTINISILGKIAENTIGTGAENDGVCPHCGKSISGEMGFCIHCGKKL